MNSQENADLVFFLGNSTHSPIYAHKALLLFRTIERELQPLADPTGLGDKSVAEMIRGACEFLSKIYYAKPGEIINLPEVQCRSTFLNLIQFLYCDKFVDHMTCIQVRAVSEMAKTLP